MSNEQPHPIADRERPGPWQGTSLLLIAILASIGTIQLLGLQPGIAREAAFMGGIFVLAAFLWVTEALPLFATSLLIIGLEMLLLANPGNWHGFGFESGPGPSSRDILNAAASPVLVLFFGGFLLAQAAVKEKVDLAMSALLLRPFGNRPRFVLLGVMLVTALFSMWMSNTATAAMMITLIVPLLNQIPRDEPFRKALLISVPFAANIGGLGTPISSPPNAVAVGYLQKMDQPLGFLTWMLIGVPLLGAMLFSTWHLLWKMHRPKNQNLTLHCQRESLTRNAWLVVGIFTATVALWMSDRWHGLPAFVVALLPAILLTTTQIISRDDLKKIEWNVLILIAGGMALGEGILMTGLDRIIVAALPLQNAGALSVLIVLIIVTVLMSTFMSNTAAANLLLPMGISAATVLSQSGDSLSVTRVLLTVAFAASLSMALPVSTPPNAIAYGHGELTTKDMALPGILIGLVGAVLLFFGLPVLLQLQGIK